MKGPRDDHAAEQVRAYLAALPAPEQGRGPAQATEGRRREALRDAGAPERHLDQARPLGADGSGRPGHPRRRDAHSGGGGAYAEALDDGGIEVGAVVEWEAMLDDDGGHTC